MKTIRLITLTFALFLPGLSKAAEPTPPVMKESNGWLIFSGTHENHRGVMPWTFSIRKSAIVSLEIETQSELPGDREAIGGNVRFDKLTLEEIQKIPARISIVTSDRRSDGGATYWELPGLTHGTAPAMMEKILAIIAGTPAK